MISFVWTNYYYYYWDYLQRLHCVCLVVNPNTLSGKPKVYGRTNLGGKPTLSYINLVSEPNLITPFQQPKITSDNPHPHPPVENKSATRYATIQILTPRDLQTKATPILTSWDLCNYHQSSRLCLETENINSTKKKKKKIQIHNFNLPE